MKSWFLLAMAIQGLAMVFDEFYFHHRRGLPKWERVGHPVDTLVFLAALGSLWLWGPGLPFAGLAALSTLVITKDEWIHATRCSPTEHWLHAMLFVLHPVVLFLAYLSHGTWGGEVLLPVVLFFAYQISYWNFYVNRPLDARS